MKERGIQLAGFSFQQSNLDPDACFAQSTRSPCSRGIRVRDANHHPVNSSGDNGVGAGWSSAVVIARLEVYVKRSTSCPLSCRGKSHRLRVWRSEGDVIALPYTIAAATDDRADHRIG